MSFDDASHEKPVEIAAIDLGSNSFHLIVARIVGGSLQVLGRLKQRVHLADGLDEYNYLSNEAMERGLSCLSLFAERLQGFPAKNVRIVATHTLRLATNADSFLDKANQILPYPIEIISGQEEARLIYMGIAHTEPEIRRKLVIDIGGGSTELVIGEHFSPIVAESRQMGCVSYTKRFFSSGEISKKAFRAAQLAAEQELENLAYRYKFIGWEFTFGASGTIKAAHAILSEMYNNNGPITSERLEKLVQEVLHFKHFEQIKLPGLADERRDVLVAGLAILSALFNRLNIKELDISTGALREGVLYEMESRFRHQDIRERTTNSMAENYNIDIDQAERVFHTALHLYQQWKEQNRDLVHPEQEILLKWVSMLHEVGLSINYTNLHRHSAYIIQNSNLPGFNQEHQLLLATLANFQRKSIKLDELPLFHLVKRKQFIPLIQIFRLAVLLNNQRQSTVIPESLTLLSSGYHISLIFPTEYLTVNCLVRADLEREQDYWSQVTGWQLILVTEALLTTD